MLLLLIFVPKIQAKIYYLDAQALDENEYQIKETKKYRFYKEEKIYNYFIEDENDQDFLNKDNKKYSKNFNKEMSQYDIVQYLINTDDTLHYTYNLYQGIIKSIDSRDKNKFLNIIHNVDNKKLNKYSKTAIKTFLNFENYIVNAFDYELSNGLVEGTNNIIKQLKHNACGYRKFSHLKARVMLVKGIYNPLVA